MPIKSNIKDVLKSLNSEFLQHDERNKTVVRITSLELLRRIILLSPVDTGLYRASHDLTINEPSSLRVPADEGVFNEESKGAGVQNKRFEEASGRLTTQVTSRALAQGITIFISNNVRYATVLEFGTSKQAPSGVYAVVANQFDKIFNAAVRVVYQ